MIRKLLGVTALTFALALTGVARAQDAPAGGLRPTDGGAPAGVDPVAPAPAPAATPEAPPAVEGAPRAPADPGNWKGAAPAPAPAPSAAAPAANGADPLAGGAPAAPAAPAKDPNVIGNDDPRAGKIIDRNYQDAIKIYDGVLKNDGESVENLDHRIGSNEHLVSDYKKKLAEANEQKRRLQVELFNRTFYLKQQRDKGAIPEDVFAKLIKQEEKKYADRSAQVRSDCEFLEKEIKDADGRLTGLRAERRVQVVNNKTNQIANGKKVAKPLAPGQKTINTLTDRLKALNAFETKQPMDAAPVCEQCLRPLSGGGGAGTDQANAGDPGAPPPAPAAPGPTGG